MDLFITILKAIGITFLLTGVVCSGVIFEMIRENYEKKEGDNAKSEG